MSDKLIQEACTINAHEFPVLLTERAQEMAIRATKSEGNDNFFLRISIRGGGCSGLQYSLDIDDKHSPFDVLCNFNDLQVAVDIFSLHYLTDTTIDYQETLEGAGFKFNNPNARKTCGCGSSFSA